MSSVDSIGARDRVRLRLGGREVLVAESYEVRQSVLTQPSAFSLRLGWGGVVRELLAMAPPRTPFELLVGDALRATGVTDGFEVDQSAGTTQITIRGRDMLAALHDAYVLAERSFTDATYTELVKHALREVALPDRAVEASNAANRRIMTGVAIATGGTRTPEQIVEDAPSRGTVVRAVHAKIGERWFQFLRRHLDRAGLFLWARADGHFVLARPQPDALPSYRIVRRRGATRDEVSVVAARFKNETTPRFTEVIAYSRGGGARFSRAKAKGRFADDEMLAMGYRRPLVVRDTTATNEQQAELFARRKLADGRRAGWQLVYTVSGHSTPAIGAGARAVWTPDTVVLVDDDELDLHGPFYVESVDFRRPPTTTTLTLMRAGDMLFGGDE